MEEMTKNIAGALGIEENRLNLKATTEEGLGFTGTGEGMASQAICSLVGLMDYAGSDRDALSDCGSCPGCRR